MHVVDALPDVEAMLADALKSLVVARRSEPAMAILFDVLAGLRGGLLREAKQLEAGFEEIEEGLPMSADALDRVLVALDDGDRVVTPGRPRFRGKPIAIPPYLEMAVQDAEAVRRWRRKWPGIRALWLTDPTGVRVELLHIDPSRRAPRHRHFGAEVTVCISGGFHDENGRYGPGDMTIADPFLCHTPTADGDGPCLILIVSDAGLRFTGILGILQSLLGLDRRRADFRT